MDDPALYVISGPTAVGKGTVVRELQEAHPSLKVSVSATTRKPRPGEQDGVSYFFLSEPEFLELKESGELLEFALVHGSHYYGTPRGPVEEQLAAGNPVLLEIDVVGAMQVRAALPESRLIFLLPPSWEELRGRLIGRGTETSDEQERRLATAKVELESASEFDFTVINDNLDRAVAEVAQIMGLN